MPAVYIKMMYYNALGSVTVYDAAVTLHYRYGLHRKSYQILHKLVDLRIIC